jgi:hypothetical protein
MRRHSSELFRSSFTPRHLLTKNLVKRRGRKRFFAPANGGLECLVDQVPVSFAYPLRQCTEVREDGIVQEGGTTGLAARGKHGSASAFGKVIFLLQ